MHKIALTFPVFANICATTGSSQDPGTLITWYCDSGTFALLKTWFDELGDSFDNFYIYNPTNEGVHKGGIPRGMDDCKM